MSLLSLFYLEKRRGSKFLITEEEGAGDDEGCGIKNSNLGFSRGYEEDKSTVELVS